MRFRRIEHNLSINFTRRSSRITDCAAYCIVFTAFRCMEHSIDYALHVCRCVSAGPLERTFDPVSWRRKPAGTVPFLCFRLTIYPSESRPPGFEYCFITIPDSGRCVRWFPCQFDIGVKSSSSFLLLTSEQEPWNLYHII